MNRPLLTKLNILAALIAVSTVLLAAFGAISLFVAVPVMVVVFVFGFVSRSFQDGPTNGKARRNG